MTAEPPLAMMDQSLKLNLIMAVSFRFAVFRLGFDETVFKGKSMVP
jgi:hypothetical protein